MVYTMELAFRIFERLLLIVGCMRSFGGRSLFHFLVRMFVCVRASYCLSMVFNKGGEVCGVVAFCVCAIVFHGRLF